MPSAPSSEPPVPSPRPRRPTQGHSDPQAPTPLLSEHDPDTHKHRWRSGTEPRRGGPDPGPLTPHRTSSTTLHHEGPSREGCGAAHDLRLGVWDGGALCSGHAPAAGGTGGLEGARLVEEQTPSPQGHAATEARAAAAWLMRGRRPATCCPEPVKGLIPPAHNSLPFTL